MEIVDFHTHPFTAEGDNICSHKEYCGMSAENTPQQLRALGISRICGSVIWRRGGECADDWEAVQKSNAAALSLAEQYDGFYIPGIHVHPGYVRESCMEIERAAQKGVKLIGELVPYMHGWSDYSCKEFDEILDVAKSYGMVVSFHSMGEDNMDAMVKKHPDVVFVAAHPGEYGEFMRHMERMRYSENYYLDLSGYGIFRHGMLRHALDLFGAQRFVFGSDFPTCNPAMYIGGVMLDTLISDAEKEQIFSQNAKRLLKID